MHTHPPTSSMTSPLSRSDLYSSSIPTHKSHARPRASRTSFLLTLTLCLSSTLTLASAHPYIISNTLTPKPYAIPDTLVPPSDFSSVLKELAELEAKGIVLLDTRPPPRVPSDWDLATFSSGLLKRGYLDIQPRDSSDSDPEPSTTPSSSPTTATTSSSTTAPSAQTTGALPSPFDTNIGANFSSPACPKFITDFLASPQFKQCLPLSMLLESSTSMFSTLKSPFLTTALLDHTCAAPPTCAPYLSTLASNLTTTCASDLTLQNPTVTMALAGLLAYPALLSASCLKSSTGSYCFADAITNSSSTEDAYIYYLGLGQALPEDTEMTCNQCLKDVVGVFGAAAANRSVPVAGVYEEGAGVVNKVCGKGWVNETVPNALTGGAARVSGMVGAVVAVLVAAALV